MKYKWAIPVGLAIMAFSARTGVVIESMRKVLRTPVSEKVIEDTPVPYWYWATLVLTALSFIVLAWDL